MPRKPFRTLSNPGRRRRFNEAAARCRGNRTAAAPRPGTASCFNEAAARCRGNQTNAGVTDVLRNLLQ